MTNRTFILALATVCLAGGLASTTAPADVVGYWRIEDGTSGSDIVNTADSSVNGLTAEQWVSNEVSAKYSSHVGGAYVYDPVADTYTANTLSMHAVASTASDDTQLIAKGAGGALTADDWTFEMFIQVLDNGGAATLDSSDSTRILNIDSGNSATFELEGDFLQARVRDTTVPVDANRLSFANYAEDGNWHHLAFTVSYDSTANETTLELFYDYASLGSDTSSGKFTTKNDLRFGVSSTSDGDYDWYFDEARLSTGLLTTSQFLTLSSVPEPGALSLLGVGGLLIAPRRRRA